MRTNALRARIAAGEATFGAWLTIPSGFVAEVMARQRYDWLCIDMQHGLIEYRDVVAMLQAIGQTETTPIVRVPWNEPGIIGKVLDAGAMGVIVPMVNSAAEAEAAVRAARYFPQGLRSFGPARAAFSAGSDYFAEANREILVLPQIETRQAVEQLDAILSVPGLDGIYVGPADLSITLGLPPANDNGGAFEEARVAIAEACRRHGVIAGIHATAPLAARHVAAGYQFINVSADVPALVTGVAADLELIGAAKAVRPVY
jgi:4-hydroxy-2-oxoheptanedioate aldolase